jgi:DNA-3-methyladenine glycosylase
MNASERILPVSFYERPTAAVARDLLGKLIVRGNRRARVVETEAYLDPRDAASHARFGPDGRSAILFGPAGRLYVFLVYGMHHCMNVVTEGKGRGGAVLFRAAETDGGPAKELCGPGRLCRGLGVTRKDNGLDLTSLTGGIFVADDGFRPGKTAASPRIGVDYAGAWARRKLRFYVPGHPAVSGLPR